MWQCRVNLAKVPQDHRLGGLPSLQTKPLTLLPAPVRDDGRPKLFCVHQWEMLVAQHWRCRMEPLWMGYGPVTPPCSPHSASADQASGGDPPTARRLRDGG